MNQVDPAASARGIQAILEYGGFIHTNAAGTVQLVSLVYDETKSGERRECTNRSDAVLTNLVAFPHLEELRLIEGQATDRAMAQVGRCASLRRLYLWQANGLSDQGAASLAPLRELESLHINNARIGDAALAVFARLPKLRRLTLQGHDFSDAGLRSLGAATSLQSLWVGNGGGRITDAGLAALRSLTNLTELEVQHCAITDAGLQPLKEMRQLRRLYLDGTQVTPAGVAALQAAIPALEVQW